MGPGGGADRPAFSASEARAIELVAGWAREAGLDPALDEFGNLWALPAAPDRVVTAGSHVDTVPDGGRYDGALGTVLGLELAHEIGSGLLVCAAEEAPRFGAGTVGSRLLAGTLELGALDAMHDADGISAADARQQYLRALAALPVIAAPVGRVIAHAEVHVAQRRALRELGVVTRVASPRRLEVVITGEAGHSGEVSMADRHDALAAAAELVLAVEAAAQQEPAETVATVGVLSVSPGAVSVIPGSARLEIDARGIDVDSLDRIEASIRAAARRIASSRRVGADVTLLRAGNPVALDRGLIDSALQAATEAGVTLQETWSGAGHDAQHLASLMPTLLIFVPLHGGESHSPQEGAEMDEIVQSCELCARALLTAAAGYEKTVRSATATSRP